MENVNTIYALKDKRSAIIGEIRHLESEVRKLRVQLGNVEGTLAIFAPEEAAKDTNGRPAPNIAGYFRHREIPTMCLTILRTEAKPMTVRALAKAIVAAKGLPATELPLENMVRTRLRQYLRAVNQRGLVARMIEGNAALWSLTEK
jgi:hypothetical protein